MPRRKRHATITHRPKRTGDDQARPWWSFVLIAVLLVIVTFIAYSPILSADFVNWDDDFNVYQNAYVINKDGLSKIWFSADQYQYYPITFSSFWIEYHLLGAKKTETRTVTDPATGRPDYQMRIIPNAARFHQTNVMLHAINALLVWWVLRRLNVPGALLAALAFALHPVHVESVAWVTERKNLLMAFFALLTTGIYLRYERNGNPKTYAASVAVFLCALLSKAAASMLAPALVVLHWMRGRPFTRLTIARWIPFFVLGGAMGTISSWFERTKQFANLPMQLDIAPLERVIVAGRCLWFYLRTLLWPANLMLVNPRWDIDTASWSQWIWPLSLLALCGILFALRGRIGRRPPAALAIFLVFLLPASGIFDVYWMVYSWVADHFQYLASVPIIALVCGSANAAYGYVNGRVRNPLVLRIGTGVAAAVLLIVLAGITHEDSKRFRDSLSLWQHSIDKNPDAWIAHNFLGSVLAGQGRHIEAISHYKRTLELFPDHPFAGGNLGHEYQTLGRIDEAIETYRAALTRTDNPAIRNNYGYLLASRGRHEEAVLSYLDSLRVRPESQMTRLNLARSLMNLGRFGESGQRLLADLERQPDDPTANHAVGMALMEIGRSAEAIPFLERAAQTGDFTFQQDLANAREQIASGD